MLRALRAPLWLRAALVVAPSLLLAAGSRALASTPGIASAPERLAEAGTNAEAAAEEPAEPPTIQAPVMTPTADPANAADRASAAVDPPRTPATPSDTPAGAVTSAPPAKGVGKATGVTVGASVYARYAIEEPSIPLFEMDRVRLNAKLVPTPWLMAAVELDALKVPNVKDAFVRARASRLFGVTAGQFKKPFGLIELTSTRQLPLVSRGIVDKRIVRELGLGGRDLGLQIQGALGPVAYAVGGFNGNAGSTDGTAPAGTERGGKDSAARLVWSAAEELKLGLSLALHGQSESAGVTSPVWASGIDARLKGGPFRVRFEALWAEQPLSDRRRRTAGGILYGYTRIPFVAPLALEPVAKIELLDDDIARGNDRAWSALAGCNLHLTDSLRVLLQAQQIWAGPSSVTRPSRQLILELTFDHDLRFGGGDDDASAP